MTEPQHYYSSIHQIKLMGISYRNVRIVYDSFEHIDFV
jgi:hypothetical protein